MSDDQNLEIEDQEREEILEEIDELVASNRLPVSEDMEKLKPQKSGAAFPIVINFLAVAAVLSTFYFSSRLFEQKQEDLTLENASYLSAEGKLLEELKKESAAQLEEKDKEIGAIQNELEALDRQSRELVETMDQQIADREAELRVALEAELEAERAKLQAQGKSETDIEEELKQIEAERTAEYEAELAAFRTQTEAAIAEKEEELARARALNEELLAEVNSEKERIQNETKQRETELTARFEAEKAALAEEAAEAEAQLEQLTADQARESLIIDQINGSYESIFSLLESGDTEEALGQVEALRALINDPGVASLKTVSSRSGNDRAMLDIIRERLEEQAYKQDVDVTSLTAAADLLLSAQEIAALGAEAYRAGNYSEAETYYTRSLEKIPALKQAWTNLDLIEKDLEASRMSVLIAEGKSLEELGRESEAAKQYADAATAAFSHNPELLEQAVSAVLGASETNIFNQLSEKDSLIADKDNEITQLKDQIEKEIDRLETQLEQNEKSYSERIASLESEWQAKLDSAGSEFELQLSDTVAGYESRLSEAETNYEAMLAETEAGYESRLSETEAGYETRLSEADAEAGSLEGEKNDEIDRLTRLIGERDAENLRINTEREEALTALAEAEAEIEETAAELAEAEKTIEEGRAYIAELETSSAAEIEAVRAEMNEEIDAVRSASEAEIAGLKAELEAEAAAEITEETDITEKTGSVSSAELEAVQAEADAEIAKIRSEADSRVSAIEAESDAEIAELEAELAAQETEYSDLEVKYELLRTSVESRMQNAQAVGVTNGISQGRTSAFEDVLSFTEFIDGSRELDDESEARISELSSEESLYADTIRKIQDIAASGAAPGAAGIINVAQNILVGTISYASGNRITIEPLNDVEIEVGTRITIKRKERGKDEYYITFGAITSVSEGRISARTDPAGTEQARSMDLVYITR